MPRNRTRLFAVPVAATCLIGALAAPAQALEVYDARTLALGGNTVGYAGNASLVQWNPAAAARGKNLGVFLPTLAVTASNNILGVGEFQGLLTAFNSLGKGNASTPGASNDLGSLFGRLSSTDGLNIQAGAFVEPLGLAIPHVGPGTLAIRLNYSALATGRISLSPDFATDLNGLVFQGGFTSIAAAAQALTSGGQSNEAELRQKVASLRTSITGGMSSFLIGRNGKTAATEKSFQADISAGSSGGLNATYGYQVGLPAAMTKLYPDSQLSIGATGKLLGLPIASGLGSQKLDGGSNSTLNANFNPLSGSTKIALNIDKEVTNLLNAIESFEKNSNLATTGDLFAATDDFISNGLKKSRLEFSSVTPDNFGVAADVGAHLQLDRWWGVGLTLVNPLLFWNAKQSTYQYVINPANQNNPLSLQQVGTTENVAYRAAQPFTVRVGGAFTPQMGPGRPGILQDLLVTGGLDAPLITGTNLPIRPSISLGVEKPLGPIAFRLGTQQLGFGPFYTAGLGVQTSKFQLNLGAGVDNPGNIKGAAVSLTMGAGF